jgi:Zn-dependent protease/CBS domain-containing protein
MFRHTIPIDLSWFLLIGLLTWMLAASYYPVEFPGWTIGQYWLMGLVTALMLFASVLIHELGHSVVAKGYGMSVPRIVLFIFGGVSEISAEPPSATAEFWIAIIGPVVSFVLAAFFWELEPLTTSSPQLFALVKYLAYLNLILGLFNVVPGFPLDGGRVLRALIWRFTGRYRRATAIAATTGRFLGFALIFLGVWQALTGSFISGLWTAFIGWFLESAAGSQLQMEIFKSVLGDHKVYDAMKRDFPQVSGDTSLQALVDRYVLPGTGRYFVVNTPSGYAGLVTLDSIRKVPRSDWPVTTAAQVMVPLQNLDSTRPDAVLWTALEKMGRDGVNQLPVIEGNGIVGVLTREDVVHYLHVLQAFAR